MSSENVNPPPPTKNAFIYIFNKNTLNCRTMWRWSRSSIRMRQWQLSLAIFLTEHANRPVEHYIALAIIARHLLISTNKTKLTPTFIAISSCINTAFSRSNLWASGLIPKSEDSGSIWTLSNSITVIFTAARSFFSCCMWSRSFCSSTLLNSVSELLAVELVVLKRQVHSCVYLKKKREYLKTKNNTMEQVWANASKDKWNWG